MRNRCLVVIFKLILLLIGSSLFADDDGWRVASKSPELTVYERARAGSAIREIKAIGVMGAPPEVIKRVIDDVEEYPRFMPYVVESRIVSRDGVGIVSYQRISPPLVSDRDYTLRVRSETRPGAGGTCFCNTWQVANDLGPAEKSGVSRVKITEGSWLLEPEDEGRKARVTYRIFSDSGGSLPAAIANAASRTAIPKLFDSVQKQARLAKYLGAR